MSLSEFFFGWIGLLVMLVCVFPFESFVLLSVGFIAGFVVSDCVRKVRL